MSAEGQAPAEDNKAVVKRFWDEVFNRANHEVAYEILAPDYLLRDPDAARSGEIRGPGGMLTLLAKFRGRYQDLRAAINWQLEAEGNHVVSQYTLGGTVVGTGNRVEVEGLSISLISDARIARSWASWDAEGLVEQDRGPGSDGIEEGAAAGVPVDPEPFDEGSAQADKKALVRRFWQEVFNEEKHPVAEEIFAPEYRLYGPAAKGAGQVTGPAGIAGLVKKLRDGHPGVSSTVFRQRAAEEGRIVTHYAVRRPGRDRLVEGMSVSRFVDQKIVESWANWDVLSLRIDHDHESHWSPWWWR